ncbi:MAG: RbtT/DalT/CsbX family MFS transporter, partial [Alistipes sp.]|nr:RbtT/DalT/CsbX family MFS transporter [Candidatus Minthomonas equi]
MSKTGFSFLGLPGSLVWGFAGILVFMTGEGIEQTWLSIYMDSQGMDPATLYSVYGFTVALSSCLSGVIAQTYGIRRTMLTGYFLYLTGVLSFAFWGVSSGDYLILLTTYSVKGFGYPLFAYTFIVWITYRVEKSKLSSAQGWFWFVFTGGLNVFGAYYVILAKNSIGVTATLASAAVFATIGAVFALWLNKSGCTNLFSADSDEGKQGSRISELFRGFGIVAREPKVLTGGIVKIINSTSQFAFIVFMPLYMAEYGITDVQWASIWGSIFIFNIVFNLIFGIVGDRFGWGRTVIWFGGVGCAVTVLLFYYSPQLCNEFWFILLCGILWCIMLAGYVPLSALIPSLVEKDKGAAVSVLNLGTGLAAVTGP